MAKAKAGRVGSAVTLGCVELCGSVGYAEAELLEKWARDSKILDIFEGTQQIQLLIVARRLLGLSSAELACSTSTRSLPGWSDGSHEALRRHAAAPSPTDHRRPAVPRLAGGRGCGSARWSSDGTLELAGPGHQIASSATGLAEGLSDAGCPARRRTR